MLYRHPARRLHPKFARTIQSSDIPRHMQALFAGFAQAAHLSNLIHSRRRIPLTPLTRRRLEELARLLNYPTDQIFAAEEPQEEAMAR